MAEPPVQIRNTCAAVTDHSRQYAGFTFVYPVISRRSRGLSLGINLNPDKCCNFDCIYCEVDRRTPGQASRVDLPQMRKELTDLIRYVRKGGLGWEARFAELPATTTREIQDLAFSGDGEPTMIDTFAACVQAVADIKRAEGLDTTKIVLITDAAGLDKADVKRGLEIMDANQGEIWGKLDAGTEAYFRRVNRTTIRFDRILKNLLETARVRPIVIQSLFLKVHGEAMPTAELDAYGDRLNALVQGGARIREVHAYTVARPTPEVFATRLSREELEAIAATIRRKTGLAVQSFE
jgi:wyosine [tRNA(Phe)-imidazoG37] synthetase (radical SAM superfamily)